MITSDDFKNETKRVQLNLWAKFIKTASENNDLSKMDVCKKANISLSSIDHIRKDNKLKNPFRKITSSHHKLSPEEKANRLMKTNLTMLRNKQVKELAKNLHGAVFEDEHNNIVSKFTLGEKVSKKGKKNFMKTSAGNKLDEIVDEQVGKEDPDQTEGLYRTSSDSNQDSKRSFD